MATFRKDLTGCYFSREHKLVHTQNDSGEVLMLMFSLGKKNTGPIKVQYLNINSKDDGRFYMERIDDHETLIKTSLCQSKEKMKYLIEEFIVEWDFFSTMPPDSLSKLVGQTQYTFFCVQNQLQIKLESWKQDEQKVEMNVFVKSEKKSDSDSFENWSSKLKDFNPRKCEEMAKELHLEFRNEMWGIHDGKLRGFCEDYEEDQMFKRGEAFALNACEETYEGQDGVKTSSEGQDVAER